MGILVDGIFDIVSAERVRRPAPGPGRRLAEAAERLARDPNRGERGQELADEASRHHWRLREAIERLAGQPIPRRARGHAAPVKGD